VTSLFTRSVMALHLPLKKTGAHHVISGSTFSHVKNTLSCSCNRDISASLHVHARMSLNHTHIISNSELELAQSIASQFPVPTIPRHTEIILAEPCPCDTCPVNPVCKDTGHECQAFRQFVRKGK